MFKIATFFLPHHTNHHRAHALKTPAIFSYIFVLVLIQLFLRVFSVPGSNILGVSTNISTDDVINLTNEKRVSAGVGVVKESALLSQAAAAKAQDMLDKNYWAHFAPDGKTPWQFISESGYRYSAAGENLARDFDSASAVVVAWMNSPSHKDNLLDPRFTEIGVAVTSGNLNGVNGSLVVQMFASPSNPITKPPTASNVAARPIQQSVIPIASSAATPAASVNQPQSTSSPPHQADNSNGSAVSGAASNQKISSDYLLNPFTIIKTASLAISIILVFLIGIDILYVRRNRINRALHHNFAHMFVFLIFGFVIFFISSGSIL